ncbi:MAG: DUF3153 domain-containing protein [Clostridiaceae bacterium]
MKKLIGVLLTILLAVSLTGCVKGKVHLTINKDKTADVEISLGMEKSLYSMMGGADPFAELKTSLKKEGYKVSDYTDDTYSGIVGKNHYSDLDKSIKEIKLSDKAVLSGNDSLKVDKGFFFNKYTINTNLDMSSIASDTNISEDEKKLQDMFIKSISFDFIITTPMKAINSNAASVSKDKKTYTWKLVPGKNNNINLTLKVPNTVRIILTSAVILLIIILLVIIIKRKNKKEEEILI